MQKYNQVQNMMVNILELGEEYIFKYIEKFSDPFYRIQQRELFYIALRKLKQGESNE